MTVVFIPETSKRGAFSPDVLAANADSLPTTDVNGALPIGLKAFMIDTFTWKIYNGSTWTAFDMPASTGGGGGAVTVADGADVAEGTTTDAAVAAGAAGTISAKLRSISRDLIANIVLAAGANVIGGVTIADGSNVNQGANADAVVAGGAAGTISAKLRRLTTDLAALLVNIPGILVQKSDTVSTTATLANVASSATNVTLQASNAARKGWSVYNDSTAILFIKYAATASATSYTVQLAPGEYFELARGNAIYTGIIDGIWASANGNARVTEW